MNYGAVSYRTKYRSPICRFTYKIKLSGRLSGK